MNILSMTWLMSLWILMEGAGSIAAEEHPFVARIDNVPKKISLLHVDEGRRSIAGVKISPARTPATAMRESTRCRFLKSISRSKPTAFRR